MRATTLGMVVPFVDPQGSFDASQGQYAVRASDGTWTTVTSVTPVPEHVFDVAEITAGLFLFGGAGNTATIWRSTDNGVTWAASLEVAGSGTARFYTAMPFSDGTITTVLVDGSTNTTYRWDGSAWAVSTGPDLPVGGAGRFVYEGVETFFCLNDTQQSGEVLGGGWHVRVRPGDSAAALTAAIPDHHYVDAKGNANGTHLYLLADGGNVYRGLQSGDVTLLLTLDVSPVCFAVDEAAGKLYLGMNDSTIRTADIPA